MVFLEAASAMCSPCHHTKSVNSRDFSLVMMVKQQAAVAHFLKTSTQLPPSSFYNGTSRAYPDVSAASQGFWVVANKIPSLVVIALNSSSNWQTLELRAQAAPVRHSPASCRC